MLAVVEVALGGPLAACVVPPPGWVWSDGEIAAPTGTWAIDDGDVAEEDGAEAAFRAPFEPPLVELR
jgi:hypothetical protein